MRLPREVVPVAGQSIFFQIHVFHVVHLASKETVSQAFELVDGIGDVEVERAMAGE